MKTPLFGSGPNKPTRTRSDRAGLAFAAIVLVTLGLYLLAMSLPSQAPHSRKAPPTADHTPMPVGGADRHQDDQSRPQAKPHASSKGK